MRQPTHDKRNQKQKQISLHARIKLHATHTRTHIAHTNPMCVDFQIRTDRADEIPFAKDCLISFNFDLLIYAWSNQLERNVARGGPESVRNDETISIWFSMSQIFAAITATQRIMIRCVCVCNCGLCDSNQHRAVASSANTFFRCCCCRCLNFIVFRQVSSSIDGITILLLFLV